MEKANAYVQVSEPLEVMNRPEPSQALGHILSSGLRPFYRRAYRLLGNEADAEDAVQDALVAAYTHLDQFKGQSQMSTWLTAIVQNCARMQLRRRLRHVHVPLDEPIGEVQEPSLLERLADSRPSPEDECRNAELRRRLARFRTQLSPSQRRTFQLRDVDGLSVRETARILGLPHGTVKAQSSRARKKLQGLIRRATSPRPRNLTHRSAKRSYGETQ
jgi:RNA polymerase sigma-70 factor, ECF subfamily